MTLAVLGGVLAWGSTVAGIAWWAGRLQSKVEAGIANSATVVEVARMQGYIDAQIGRIAELEKDVAAYSRWKHETIAPFIQRLEGRLAATERDVDVLADRVPHRRAQDPK